MNPVVHNGQLHTSWFSPQPATPFSILAHEFFPLLTGTQALHSRSNKVSSLFPQIIPCGDGKQAAVFFSSNSFESRHLVLFPFFGKRINQTRSPTFLDTTHSGTSKTCSTNAHNPPCWCWNILSPSSTRCWFSFPFKGVYSFPPVSL